MNDKALKYVIVFNPKSTNLLNLHGHTDRRILGVKKVIWRTCFCSKTQRYKQYTWHQLNVNPIQLSLFSDGTNSYQLKEISLRTRRSVYTQVQKTCNEQTT